jgi:hypothetical protein
MRHRPLHASSSQPAALPGLMLTGALLALVLLAAGCGLGSSVTNYIESTDSNLRKRVAVAPFTSGPASMKERAKDLNQAVSQSLVKMGGVVVSDFSAVQAEMDTLPRTITNPEDRAIEAGRLLGVNALLAGNITDMSVQRMLKGIYGFRDNTPFLTLEVELRMVDVTTGTVMGQEAFKQQEKLDDMAAEAIENGGQPDAKLVNKLMEQATKETSAWVTKHVSALAWGGVVLEVSGDKVLVSVGRDTGLSTGSVLTVYALGERIKAGTGQELALPGPRVGRIRLSELGARSSWAEIIERAGESKEAKEAVERTIKARESAQKHAKEAVEKAKAAEEKAKEVAAAGKDNKEAREAAQKARDAAERAKDIVIPDVTPPPNFAAGQVVRSR